MFKNSVGDRDRLFRHFIHAIGPHRGRHGGHHSGRFGAFMGGDGFPGGRKLGSSDLQLVLLALLAERPAHGYELIRLLEERSSGFYAPSPGMIYPALTYLDEIGHASVNQEGNRKLYAITEPGQKHLSDNLARVETILDAMRRVGGRMEQVREAFAGVTDLDPQAAEELHRARHGLKLALSRLRGCTRDEALRVAGILDQASAAIRKDS